ncbi:(Fe-S)-binding protein [Paracoccus kondratievae]|uniref:(Fe-S)-binding protein n=1 Tax=Paracoccus TaxID=265 RepID=UPI000225F727|nr:MULTISPECIES: (Fe-S)-binding protein [Paracoccus]QFQ88986.1 (Fe-S)-binding protein [Paracoccus kondratievae]SMG52362.1 L-lactate dehydrogenase complex protein LldE [Paracoccus sp. J56]
MSAQPKPRVGLFVTCLVDAIRPQIGFAALELLEKAGCEVEVPQVQTCCGQPALNSGNDRNAALLARQTIAAFEGYDYVVLPSGSCAATMVHGYPELLADDPDWTGRARAMAAKTHEITSFLHDVLGYVPQGVRLEASATYHDSCSGLRDLGVAEQPRALLSHVEGLNMRGLPGNDVCCGFGGTFCVKYPDISNAIVTEKAEAIEGTGADILLAGDLGCLMNMAGKLHRRGARTRCFHTIEVLAGRAGGPAIGEEAS